MCMFSAPKIPATPPPAQYQQMQNPKDMIQDPRHARGLHSRRGMFASVFTSPIGVSSAPKVTGSTGGLSGG